MCAIYTTVGSHAQVQDIVLESRGLANRFAFCELLAFCFISFPSRNHNGQHKYQKGTSLF